MNQKAQSSGVEVWHNSHVINIKKETHGFSVVIKFNKEQKEVFTKFVIGADGATSLLRRTLFPKLRVTYSQAYQEHYQWELDIDKSYFHWFYPIECSPAGFAVHQKDGLLIIDAGGRIGQKNQLIGKAKDFLAKNYHFDINQKPIWKGSCLEPIIYRELTSHTFKPAIGNALLVGDAAGLVMPISCEGIGTSMKSGLLAASSIKKAIESGQSAEVPYLSGIKGIISMFDGIYPWFRRIIEETRSGGHSLPKILHDSYLDALRMF